MPLYEYECRRCEHQFEELVFGVEKVACPACNCAKVERRLSVPARPQSAPGGGLNTACDSDGPPCGPQCGRFR